jgi:hypothetical protein
MTNNSNKEFLDCILLPFRGELYILPTVAVAELGTLGEYNNAPEHATYLGEISWRGLTLPLVTPNLNSKGDALHQPKFAILNALFSDKQKPPFFATVVEDQPFRIKVKPQELTWLDEPNRKVVYSQNDEKPREMILLDLENISKEVESLL